MECTAHHPGSKGVTGIMSVTMPLLRVKDRAVATSDQYRKLSRDERHFILLKTSHRTSNGMVPPEFVVLFTKFSLKIGIKEADKCTLVSNESAVNEFENLQ